MKETVGQQLRQAREKRSLSIEQVARATHMRLHYIRAMEEGNFEAMPSMTQARGFLRTYARFLDLDPEPLLDILNRSHQGQPDELPPAPAHPQPQTKPNPADQEASAIFADIGQKIRHQRELLGLSLDDVVRHTHLKRHYLQALESGNLNGLPSPVQGRGMLKNYAAFLGLDPEPLLLQFADGLQARLAMRKTAAGTQTPDAGAAQPERKRRSLPRISLPLPLRRLLSSDLLIGVFLGASLVAFAVLGSIRIFTIRAEETPAPTAPPIAEVLLATPSPSPTITPEPVTSSPESESQAAFPTQPELSETQSTADVAPPASGTQAVQIYMTVNQRAWVRVLVDGEVELEGRVLPGSAYSFAGDEQIEILTGNGGALQLYFNQQDLGPMGSFGEVVNLVFTEAGLQLPTPTVTPTGTTTPPTTPTPEASPTAGPGTATVPPLP